ncbi:MAG TPA: nicotinate-nucleotide--dimethylbenzimidazole phosphoribosyltransferase [Stellaceae bacterium]|jgi:nicotinate-nucleotide--dimethylbenzimidazole phosphoribosyltransferase|nr:nicotinate-nucleotide--dimethylbenzimidazole phosphoribosyltransferase [Stellaceae bacterium]
MPEPMPELDEIRALLSHLPGPDLEAGTAAALRERQLAKRPGELGRLEDLAAWLATWQARHPPRVEHPRTVVFAANHGVAARVATADPPSMIGRQVQSFVTGGGAVNQLCRIIDADLRVYELDLDTPTGDIVEGEAMSEGECARAIAYGMMAVEPGIDALAVGAIGAGGTIAAAALCLALFGGEAGDWIGVGGGTAGAASVCDAIAAAVARHREAGIDAFGLLCRLGGLEFAATAGAILAARMGRVPVVLDGFSACAGAAVLHAADPRALDHCVAGHVMPGPAHRRLLERLGKPPLLDLGISGGEAVGATLALSLLRAAAACHDGMATTADAGATR